MPSCGSLTPDRATMARAVRTACLEELRAFKPGNVHVHAAGHRMSVRQFEVSAEALAEAVMRPSLGVGQRIYEAVRLTNERVGCNTNLGIVLLTVPLAEAALAAGSRELRARLEALLAGLTVADADWAFRAIALAAPAGLGRSREHDVGAPARVPLRDAMAQAAHRDRIARQYATAYEDVFALGLPGYLAALARWRDPGWAAALAYLLYLAGFPDTHIARKHGEAAAAKVCRLAKAPLAALRAAEDPETCRTTLLALDGALKRQALNPGTSADLTVATLLAARLSEAS